MKLVLQLAGSAGLTIAPFVVAGALLVVLASVCRRRWRFRKIALGAIAGAAVGIAVSVLFLRFASPPWFARWAWAGPAALVPLIVLAPVRKDIWLWVCDRAPVLKPHLGRRREEHPALPPPKGLVPDARLAGLLYGMVGYAASFVNQILTLLAIEFHTTADGVQEWLRLAMWGGVIWLVARIVTSRLGRRFAPKLRFTPRFVGVAVVLLGSVILLLGVFPSLELLAAEQLFVAMLQPSVMLVRDGVTNEHPALRSFCHHVSQVVIYLSRVISAIVFTALVVLALDVTGPIVALGVSVMIVGLLQVIHGVPRSSATADPSQAPAAPIPIGKLLRSPTFLTLFIATLGIYTAFPMFWSEVQPRLEAVGFGHGWAALIAGSLSLLSIVSLGWIRKYADMSDEEGSKRAAIAACGWLLAAGLFGALTLPAIGKWAVIPLVLYALLIEIGAGSTSNPVTTGLTGMGVTAALMASLGRVLAGAVAGQIAPWVGWLGAVVTIGIVAMVTLVAVKQLQRHPAAGGHFKAPGGDEIRIELAKYEGPDPDVELECRVVADGREVLDWEIWQGDSFKARDFRLDGWRSERLLPLASGDFTWSVRLPRRVRETSEWRWLWWGRRLPIPLDGHRMAKVTWWGIWPLGRWRIRGNGLELKAPELRGHLQFNANRHGRDGLRPAEARAHGPAPARAERAPAPQPDPATELQRLWARQACRLAFELCDAERLHALPPDVQKELRRRLRVPDTDDSFELGCWAARTERLVASAKDALAAQHTQ